MLREAAKTLRALAADAPPSTNSGEVVNELVVGINMEMVDAARLIVEWLNEFECAIEDEGGPPLDDDWSIGFPEVLEGLEIGFLRRLRTALAAAHKEGK